MALGELGELYVRLGFSNPEEFVSALKGLLAKAENEAATSGQKAGQGWAESLKASIIGGAVGAAFAQVFAAAQAEISRFVQQGIDEFSKIDRALTLVRASGESNLGAVRQAAKELAQEFGIFAESDILVAMSELIKQGLDATQAVQALRGAIALAVGDMDAATGAMGDLGAISSQVVAIIRAFRADIGEASRYADILAKAAAGSSAGVGDLAAALATIAPTAASAGLSIEETAAILASFTNQGIPAQEAATALRSALNALADPPAEVRKKLDQLGITLLDSTGKARGFSETLQNLSRVAANGEEAFALLSKAMDTLAANAALAMGRAAQDILGMSSSLANADGAARQMAQTMGQTLTAQMEVARAKTREAAAALGEAFAPVMVHIYQNVLPPFLQGVSLAIARLSEMVGLLDKGALAFQEWQKTYGQVPQQYQGRIQAALAELTELERKLAVAEKTPFLFGRGEVEAWKARAAELRQELVQLQREASEAARKAQAQEKQPKAQTFTPRPAPIPTLLDEGTGGGKEQDKILQQIRELEGRLQILAYQYKQGRLSAEEYAAGLSRIRQALEGIRKAADTTERKVALEGALTRITDTIRALQVDKLERLQTAFEAGLIPLEQYARGLRKLEEEAKKAGDPQMLARVRQEIARLEEEQKRRAEEVQKAAQRAFEEWQKLQRALEEGRALSRPDSWLLGEKDLSRVEDGLSTLQQVARGFSEAISRLQEEATFADALEPLQEYRRQLLELKELIMDPAMWDGVQEGSDDWLALSEAVMAVDNAIAGVERRIQTLEARERAFTQRLEDAMEYARRLQSPAPGIPDKDLSPGGLQTQTFDDSVIAGAEAITSYMRELRQAYELGGLSLSEYRARLEELLPDQMDLISSLEAGTPAWIRQAQVVHALTQEIQALNEAERAFQTRLEDAMEYAGQLQGERDMTPMGGPDDSRDIRANLSASQNIVRDLDRALALGLITLKDYRDALAEQVEVLRQVQEGLDALSPEYMDLEERIQALTASIEKADTAIGIGKEGLEGLKAAEDVARIFNRLQDTLAEAATRLEVLGDEFDYGQAVIRAYKDAIVALIQAGLDPASEEVQRLKSELEAVQALVAASQMTKGERQRRQSMAAFQEGGGVAEGEDQWNAFIDRMGQRFADALVEGITSGDLESALQKVFNDVARQFGQILAEQVFIPLFQDLGRQIGGELGGGLGTALGGLLGGLVGSLVGGLLGGLVDLLSPRGSSYTDSPVPEAKGASAANRAMASAPSITYHAETHVEVNLDGGLNDPVVRAQIVSLAEETTMRTLRRLGVVQ